MVGDNTGTMYKGQEGQGYAETFDVSKLLLANEKAKQAGAAQRDETFKKMAEAAPKEVWHHYSAGIQRKYEDWVRAGATIMANNNITDPWKSTNPEAIEWQLQGANLKKEADNINQAQDLYQKAMQNIAANGTKYDAEYVRQIENFGIENSFEKIASGDYVFPKAVFSEPGDIYEKFFVKDVASLKSMTKDGIVPTDDAIMNRVEVFFNAPENEQEKLAAQQMWGNLDDEAKSKYLSIAERIGYEDNPWMALAFDNYKKRFTPTPKNLMQDVIAIASKAPKNISEYSNEDSGGVTVGGSSEKLSNKEYPIQAAKSYFTENSYLLDDPDFLSELGVDINVPRAERRQTSIKILGQLIAKNITQKTESFTSRQGSSSGFRDVEVASNFDEWRKDIGSSDPTVAAQAAKFLYGLPSSEGFGKITDATVKIDPRVTAPFKTNRHLVLVMSDAKEAAKFKDKFLQEAIKGDSGLNTGQLTALQEAMSFYEKKSGPATVSIPVLPEYEQILKRLHDQTARQNKVLYRFEGNRSGEFDNLGGGASTPSKGAFDDL